jgi:hypothetical protein
VFEGAEVAIADGEAVEVIWDFERASLIGAPRRETVA